MGLALLLMALLIVGTLLFVVGSLVVKVLPEIPGFLERTGQALGRGEPLAILGVVGVLVLGLILVAMWLNARPTGVHRPGHWEHRGEDRRWVPDERE